MSQPLKPDSSAHTCNRILDVFAKQVLAPPPIWLMRQAGRYLPEYREVRENAGGFLNLCYTPALAAKVTLQPIYRFGLDAAILFSDILVVPDALGQGVRFAEGEGPILDPISTVADLKRLDPDKTAAVFERVFETVARVRQDLPRKTALIGFCGAPWTVATYMVGGRGSPDQAAARGWAYNDPLGFNQLIDLLVDVSISYLDGQVRAGADVLQIFDSWAGCLPDDQFEAWVILPTKRIVTELKQRHPQIPIIGFPRGAGATAGWYLQETKVAGIGCDATMPLVQMRELATLGAVVQGNLDPLLLLAGGAEMEVRVKQILGAMEGVPFIFNLGHGIVPETPTENVAHLVALVRGGDA